MAWLQRNPTSHSPKTTTLGLSSYMFVENGFAWSSPDQVFGGIPVQVNEAAVTTKWLKIDLTGKARGYKRSD